MSPRFCIIWFDPEKEGEQRTVVCEEALGIFLDRLLKRGAHILEII